RESRVEVIGDGTCRGYLPRPEGRCMLVGLPAGAREAGEHSVTAHSLPGADSVACGPCLTVRGLDLLDHTTGVVALYDRKIAQFVIVHQERQVVLWIAHHR